MILFLRLFAGCVTQLAPFALLCFYPFHAHFRFSYRQTMGLTLALIAALSVGFAGLSCWLDGQMPDDPAQLTAINGVFVACLPLCLGWYLYAVRAAWQKKLFIFVFALTSALAITSLQNSFWADLPTRFLPYERPTLLSLTVITAVMLPLLMLLIKKCYLPVAEGMSAKETGALDSVSLLLFAIFASGLIPMDYAELKNPTLMMLYIILLVALFVVYAVVFRMLYHAHQSFAAQQALTLAEHRLEINREQYRRITDSIACSKRIQHDFRHHALALQGMLQAGETDKAAAYLSQYISAMDDLSLSQVCDNPIVNTMIHYYGELAKSAGVVFSARVSIPAQTPVDDGDMAVLLGNLLENAIRAAKAAQPENRVVAVNLIHSGTMLAVTVDNGYGEKPTLKDGQYLSSRQNHVGLGMGSIESIARKYEGGVEFGHDAARFHASVMLNMCPAPLETRQA